MLDHDHLFPRISEPKQTECLLYVWAIAVREVVAAFYPDVLDVTPAAGWGRAAGTEWAGEQGLDLLQLEALCLWEAAQDEDEAQGHQACVHEEGPWRTESQVHC